ncbi:MAG: sulfatase-like hydrolase/transferase [Acidobacteriota bacterium]
MVTFDTTRADHIACYGHDGVRTPTIDGLAEEGVLFEQAITPIPITLPSHSSLMTGKVPFVHGVRDNGLFALGEEQTTLAEILRKGQFRTAAAVASFPLTSEFGIDQGFELFDDRVTGRYEDLYGERVFPKDRFFFDERKAGRVNEAVLPWLEEHHAEPFFLWAHYFDPHEPHEPPPPYDQLYAHDPYLGEIAYADESLGTLLAELKRLGVYDRTLIVFTSDHGEGRGEHNEATHSHLLYESTLRVPLVIRVPGGLAGERVTQRVGIIDVLPTVLDLLNLPEPEGIQGRSLLPLLEGRGQTKPRDLYAETLSPRLSRNWGELRALFYQDLKYVHGPRSELFDLSADPKELADLTAERPEAVAGLRARLEQYLADHEVTGLDSSVDVAPETARRLAALGYLQGSGERVGPIEERLRSDGDPPQDHASTLTLYSQAKNLLFQDRPLEAHEFLLALLRTDPDNPHYLELLASAELKLGNADEALAILERLKMSPTGYPLPEDVARMAAGILSSRGEIDKAYERYREAEVLDPTAEGAYRLSRIHASRGEVHDELRFLNEALELDPTFVPARLDLAVRQAMSGELAEAEVQFRRALADHPYLARSFYNFGTFLVQNERSAEAVSYFQRAVELEPGYLQAHYALVEILLGLGEPDAAFEHFEALEELAPLSREARLALDLLLSHNPASSQPKGGA